jgi:hypothetical protein
MQELNCLIEGETIVFSVAVERDCRTVDNLKKVIQGERARSILKDVDPHTLELWKASATVDELQCEVT